MEPDHPDRGRIQGGDREPVKAGDAARPALVPEKGKIPGAAAGPKTGPDRDAGSQNNATKKTGRVGITALTARPYKGGKDHARI